MSEENYNTCMVCGANILYFPELGLPRACGHHTIAEVKAAMYAAQHSVQSDAASVSAEIEKYAKEIIAASGVPTKYWQHR